MKRLLVLASVMAWVPSAAAWAQNVGGGGVFPPNEVDQIKVDMAIEKGIKYLKANNASHLGAKDHVGRKMSNRELVLFTYVHSDVPETDPDFKTLFDDMIKDKLEATYCVALQAMVLEEVQRVTWQKRILMCAKFLVDNQGPQGYWSYGSPSIYVEDVAYDIPKRKDVETGGGKDKPGGVREFNLPSANGPKVKPAVKNKVKVKKDRDGEGHDNSNTQYAALGMRACYDSGIIIEDKVIDLAIKWLRDSQKKTTGPEEELIEGGVNGPDKPGARPGVASGSGGTVAGPSMVVKKAMPQGWCYSDHPDHEAYGSMTAGAIGSLAIWDYIKDNDDGKKRTWKNDKDIHEGLVWVAKNFSVTYNPGPYEHAKMEKDSKNQYLYYMYALERAGMLYGTEVMGAHKWYPEGAKVLIETQAANGSWGAGTVDTCFAILFLKRATRSLGVATESAAQLRAKQGK
ncbi:MAG TPA: hypothetical protein VKW04_04270 [Planctomycetota bacterium]|nr:hypothetical protein [Planctomycetota bacterium]